MIGIKKEEPIAPPPLPEIKKEEMGKGLKPQNENGEPPKKPIEGIGGPWEYRRHFKMDFYFWGIVIWSMIFIAIGLSIGISIAFYIICNIQKITNYIALEIICVTSISLTTTGIGLFYSLRYLLFPELQQTHHELNAYRNVFASGPFTKR